LLGRGGRRVATVGKGNEKRKNHVKRFILRKGEGKKKNIIYRRRLIERVLHLL